MDVSEVLSASPLKKTDGNKIMNFSKAVFFILEVSALNLTFTLNKIPKKPDSILLNHITARKRNHNAKKLRTGWITN